MSNPTQKLRNPQVGQRVTAAREESVISMIKRLIVGGEGITTRILGDQVVIEAKKGVNGQRPIPEAEPVVWMKTATTKAGLEEPVSEVWFGRVTDGAQKGMVCVRNPDNDGWDAFTHFE